MDTVLPALLSFAAGGFTFAKLLKLTEDGCPT